MKLEHFELYEQLAETLSIIEGGFLKDYFTFKYRDYEARALHEFERIFKYEEMYKDVLGIDITMFYDDKSTTSMKQIEQVLATKNHGQCVIAVLVEIMEKDGSLFNWQIL